MNAELRQQRRRERMRWNMLRVLQASRPIGANEAVIARVLAVAELRAELEYMRAVGMIEIDEQDGETWAAMLTHHGIRVVEYSTGAPAGIARPPLPKRIMVQR